MRYTLLLLLSAAAFAGGEKHPFLKFVHDFEKIPGYVYFIVDVSGSVQSEKRAAAINWQLDMCLNFIPETWQYRISVFSDTTFVQKDNWIFPTKEEKETTKKWVASYFTGTGGSTIMMPALQRAFDEPPGKAVPFLICVITDAELDSDDRPEVARLLSSKDWQDKDKCFLAITINPGPFALKDFATMVASARRLGYDGGAQMLVVKTDD